ncbi:hypothetical protein [Methanococcus maripaludis]|jgi:hypothetical protein|uniref:Uncharacterized protein n=4 Tax=Methanococcus maripaludis TaxID=39152 RepID=A0A8T3VUQ0_METMI|nr:hypothetical protein [Methanococcus maripaludis]AEK19730.1 hypothetical protein GYY_04275 [Methanococcus maripaludis X1]MBG0768296.1 hypothetical protein [Methanococcus maripaludis]BAP60624.1 hypothetical protein MMKA1_05070 [Methanococcus maripaludis KA1]BAP62586.1 hypothetical protein MMOS7_05000 [Methanococcus maripaludis OS7]
MKKIIFFTFLVIFLVVFQISNSSKTDEDIIQLKLLEFGYPSSGYIISNKTVYYKDGSKTELSKPPKMYEIGGVEAYYLAQNYVDKEYGTSLESKGLMIRVEPKSIEESDKYWKFKFYFGDIGSTGRFMGYIAVNREKGYVDMEGLF